MYNRYIPEDAAYTWVGEKRGAAAPPPRPSQQHSGQSAGRGGLGALFSGNGGLGALRNGREGLGALFSSGREGEGVLTGALKSLGLEGIDAGDILLLLIIGGAIMISLGIIGHYIARIYDEVKRRPKYIVARRTDEGVEEKPR